MEAAKKEKYFPNTIFVFVGDHGIGGNATAIYPKAWTEQQLASEHVPLLFYAPALLKPSRRHSVCSQIDIMPSVASLLNVPYHNNSMGQNLFDTMAPKDCAFIIDHDSKNIGLVNSQYYFIKNLASAKTMLVSVTDNNPIKSSAATDSIKNSMERFTDAYYQTSRYLLFNNKRNLATNH